MSNVKREKAPALRALVDTSAPIVVRSEGLTGRTAVAALGRLPKGGHVFALSKGAVSAGDLIWWGVEQTGPAHCTIATWTASPTEGKTLCRLKDDGRILSLRLMLDFSFAHRHPAYAAALRADLEGRGSIALTVCHAKLAVLQNEDWNLVIRSSANLNRNSRTEYHEASDDRGLAEYIVSTLSEWFPPAADQWTATATEHSKRFEAWHGEPRERVAVASKPAAEPDAAFFESGPVGRDLRRVGLTYER